MTEQDGDSNTLNPVRGIAIWRVLVVGVLATFLIPAASYWACGVLEGLAPVTALEYLIEQYGVRRQNPALSAIPALLPLVLLAAVLAVIRRMTAKPTSLVLAIGGLAPQLALQIWTNVGFWSIYLPTRSYPGYPHGLEFVIVPLFYTPVAMALGLFIAHIALRRQ